MLEKLFFGLKHSQIRTHYCEHVSHKQAALCQLLWKTKSGKEQGKGQRYSGKQ